MEKRKKGKEGKPRVELDCGPAQPSLFSYFDFNDIELVKIESMYVCEKVVKERYGLGVHIGKMHRGKYTSKLQVGHIYKTGNKS